MAKAKVFIPTFTIQEYCDGNKSSNNRRFHLDRTFCTRHIADVSKSISHQESGILQPWQYPNEQCRQHYLLAVCVQSAARTDLVPTQLQLAQHWLDVGLVC